MKNTPFYVGILTFATIVAGIGSELRIETPDTLLQSITLSALPISVGILVGLGSRLYFSSFIASGSFSKFSLEYWLAGSTCYLLVVTVAASLSLARQHHVFVLTDWVFQFAASVLPKSLILVDIGIGIFVFAFFANEYLKTSR